MDTYYSILGVTQKATKAEIKSAYRALAVQYHPDRTPDANEAVRKLIADKMAEVNEAYAILSKDSKRAQYDALIAQQFPQAQPAVSQAQCSRCGNTIYPPTQIFGVCDACAGAQQAAQPGTQAQWGPSAIPTAGAKKISANTKAWLVIGAVTLIGLASWMNDINKPESPTPTPVTAIPVPAGASFVPVAPVPPKPVSPKPASPKPVAPTTVDYAGEAAKMGATSSTITGCAFAGCHGSAIGAIWTVNQTTGSNIRPSAWGV